jgi:dipeptidyl aminopeptidase/acylaminoacyl peptidase
VLEIASTRTHRIAGGGAMLPRASQGLVGGLDLPKVSVWSPDARQIAYLRREGNQTQIWLAQRDGGGERQLTHNASDVLDLVYSRDGARLLYQTEPSQTQVNQALAAEGRTGFLFDNRFVPMASTRPVSPPDADYSAWWNLTASQDAAQRFWVYDLAGGSERPASETEKAEYTALKAPAHKGPTTYFSAASRQGAIAWAEASNPQLQGMSPPLTIMVRRPGTAAPVVCTAPACTADDMQGVWWRNESELLFLRKEGLRLQDSALYAWRPGETRAPRLILRTANFLRPGASRCAVALDRLVCFYEQPDYPRRLISIDLDNGALKTLYDPNADFGRFALGAAPQRLAIRSASGVETFAYLVLPPRRRETGRLPLVIVTYHCDGFLRGSTGDEYPVFPLAAQGFAVLCLAVPTDLERASRLDATAYENWWRGPGIPARHRVEDVFDAAIAQLDRAGLIDPDRIAVTGFSYGAEMVHYALPHIPRLAAAIASSGAMGPSHYPYAAYARREMWRGWGLGAPEETEERWRENGFSPRVAQVFAPLLVNVSDLELLGSLDSISALQTAGRAVETYVFPDEYHAKWQPAHRLAIYNRNMDWLNFWLRGVESNFSENLKQYVRWRTMRGQVAALRQAVGEAAGRGNAAANSRN